MKRISNLLLTLLLAIPTYSQEVEMADGMREDGKIYVVIAVLLVILIGLVAYLIIIDRKATRLEKKLDEIRRP